MLLDGLTAKLMHPEQLDSGQEAELVNLLRHLEQLAYVVLREGI